MATTTPTSAPLFGHIYRKKSASPQKVARFSPYKLPNKSSSLFNLSGHAHARPEQPPPVFKLPVSQPATFTEQGQTYMNTTHVQLDFTLYRDGQQCSPSAEQFEKLYDLFPTTFKISFSSPFLVIFCRVLPAKPWPVTVAGMPLWLTDDEKAKPMDIGIGTRGPKVVLKAPIKLCDPATEAVAEEVFTMFRDLGAPISRLRWLGCFFVVFAPNEPFDDWQQRLPAMINNIRVGYIFRKDILQEKALRRKVPSKDVPDNVGYDTLRPGVLVSSCSPLGQSHDMNTTSGVCVKSPGGERYITLAHHGFPGGINSSVYHPDRGGKVIAKIAKVFGETDIALAMVNPTCRYSRETFSAADAPVIPFRNLADTDHLRVGSPIYMDTPFNGRMEGNLIATEFMQLADQERTWYAVHALTWFGNGMHTILDGCSGGVVWDDNHDVVGQFRYLDEATGTCYSATYNWLRKFGYTLAQI
ncbi:MAG: hypothetical protein Q9202_000247 [Teloschistes flavicans]